jgi:peptidoglycan hydrolase-like protein with peptidoglycan-binding domain
MTSQVARTRSNPRIQLEPEDAAAPAMVAGSDRAVALPERAAVDADTQQGARSGAAAAERGRTIPALSVEGANLGSTPTVRRGDESDDVATVQRQLNSLGYDAGEVDGKFGRKTERAVRSYQDDNDLFSDGVVGPRTHAALRAEAPVAAAPTAPVAPATPVAPAAGSDASRAALAKSLNKGYQYLIGNDFADSAAKLKAAGSQGAAIVDRGGATKESVAALKAQGVQPYAYNNAFQTQPGESVPSGVRVLESDGQWGEKVPDFSNRTWQDRRIGEAKEAAKMGFAGLMLDNVPRAEHNPAAAAQFIKRMAEESRAASGNQSFGLILQNGQDLVKQFPWLVDKGYVASVQKEDVSYHVTGAGTGTGAPTTADELSSTREAVNFMRDRWPNLPLISVDYPKTAAQAEQSLRRSKEIGFHVAHVAVGDGSLSNISSRTRTVRRIEE